MQRILIFIILVLAVAPAYANVPISGLPPVTSVGGSDISPLVQAGTTSSATMDLISEVLLKDRNTLCSISGMPAVCDAFFGYADPRWYGGFCDSFANSSFHDDGPGIQAALASGYPVVLPYPVCKIATTVKYTGNNQSITSFSSIISYNEVNAGATAAAGAVFVPNNLASSSQNCAFDFNGYDQVALGNVTMHANSEASGSAALCDSYSSGSSNGPRNNATDFTYVYNFSASDFGAGLGPPTNSSGVPISQPCNTGSCMGGSFIQISMQHFMLTHDFLGIFENISDSHFSDFYFANDSLAIAGWSASALPNPTPSFGAAAQFDMGRIEFSGNKNFANGAVYIDTSFATWEFSNVDTDHNSTADFDITGNPVAVNITNYHGNCAAAFSGANAGYAGQIILESGARQTNISNSYVSAAGGSCPGSPTFIITKGNVSYLNVVSVNDFGFTSFSFGGTASPFTSIGVGTAANALSGTLGIGLGTVAPQSTVDIAGGIAIGTGYAGIGTASLNGAIIQGKVGIGTASPLASLDVLGPIKTFGYTVSGLPAGVVGMKAYVTDQTTACPAAGAALTGGSNIVCPVFFNGSAWVGD